MPLDKYGVPMFVQDGKQYNHPVRLAHNAINMITSYHMTKKPCYLKNAKLYTKRLRDIALIKQNAMYFHTNLMYIFTTFQPSI